MRRSESSASALSSTSSVYHRYGTPSARVGSDTGSAREVTHDGLEVLEHKRRRKSGGQTPLFILRSTTILYGALALCAI